MLQDEKLTILIRVYFAGIVIAVALVMSFWSGIGAYLTAGALLLVLIGLPAFLLIRQNHKLKRKRLAEASAPMADADVTILSVQSSEQPTGWRRFLELEKEEAEAAREYGEICEIDSDLEGEATPEPRQWLAVELCVVANPTSAKGVLDQCKPEVLRDGDLVYDPYDSGWRAINLELVPSNSPPFPCGKHQRQLDEALPRAGVWRTEELFSDGEVEWDSDNEVDRDGWDPFSISRDIPVSKEMKRVRLTFGIPEALRGEVKLRYFVHDLARLTIPAT